MRVQGLGFGVRARVYGYGLEHGGLECKVRVRAGLGFRVQGSGLRV